MMALVLMSILSGIEIDKIFANRFICARKKVKNATSISQDSALT
jgi:hypothetical protein